MFPGSRPHLFTRHDSISFAAVLRVIALSVIIGPGLSLAAQTSTAPHVAHTMALHLDPEQTKIEWTVGSLLTKLHGNFKLNGGEVIADPKTGVAQGEIEIDAGSGAVQSGKSSGGQPTDDTNRTAKWQKEVLNSGRYPAIIFHPTAVEGLKEGDGGQTVKATGTVTLAGTDHALELSIKITVKGSNVTAETHFVIPYVKWGLKNPSSGFTRYDKEIHVDVSAVGTLKEGTARPSPGPAINDK